MALMREGRALFFLLLVVIAEFIIAGGAPDQETDPELRKLFRIESKNFRTPAGAIELESIRAFPPGGDEPEAIYIGAAQHFAEDRRGRIFIPDWRSDEVLVFDRNGRFSFKFGRTGQGPGEFQRPTTLCIWDDRVLVREASTNRFQLFDLGGKYLSGFAASKGHHDFRVRAGIIYAAPIWNRFTRPESRIGLIEVLDFQGKISNAFGSLPDLPKYNIEDLGSVRLAFAADGTLFVAFRFLPIIRRYSLDGTLLGEFKLESGISEKIVPINKKMFERAEAGGQFPFGLIINAIYANEDGLYVATGAWSRIEVLLLDMKGKIQEYYYQNRSSPPGFSSLLVGKEAGRKEFYILRSLPEYGVEVFARKNN